MSAVKVLLAGESWVSTSTHVKGFDRFSASDYQIGIAGLKRALDGSDIALTHLPGHLVPSEFPQTMAGLKAYDVVVLSDIGADSLLLHPDTFIRGQRTPNRLKLIADWVEAGGGLLMVGGYYSFQGINGGARYRGTPVEAALPVHIQPIDDRVEVPEGFVPVVRGAKNHPVIAGIRGPWPICSASTKFDRSWTRRFSSRRERATMPCPCSSSASTAKAAPWHGPLTSARIGCRTRLSRGKATGVYGGRPLPGSPAVDVNAPLAFGSLIEVAPPRHQRTEGAARIAFKRSEGRTRLDRLYQSGAAKVRLPDVFGRRAAAGGADQHRRRPDRRRPHVGGGHARAKAAAPSSRRRPARRSTALVRRRSRGHDHV